MLVTGTARYFGRVEAPVRELFAELILRLYPFLGTAAPWLQQQLTIGNATSSSQEPVVTTTSVPSSGSESVDALKLPVDPLVVSRLSHSGPAQTSVELEMLAKEAWEAYKGAASPVPALQSRYKRACRLPYHLPRCFPCSTRVKETLAGPGSTELKSRWLGCL